MTDTAYAGIDPGSQGAIAVIAGDLVLIEDMPDLQGVLEYLRKSQPFDVEVALEQVHPLPGQSCTASFTYGKNFGFAELLALWFNKHPVYVSPQKWKKFYGLKKDPEETKTAYKKKSIALARKLYPQAASLLKDSKDGRAEALLIAHWLKESSCNSSESVV